MTRVVYLDDPEHRIRRRMIVYRQLRLLRNVVEAARIVEISQRFQ
jgi:hypothetical protein